MSGKRSGYSGGKPADEVGPPPQTPSGSPPPGSYMSLGLRRTAEDDARLDAALAEITRGEQNAWRSRMVVCPQCGNKRCPRAASATKRLHRLQRARAAGQQLPLARRSRTPVRVELVTPRCRNTPASLPDRIGVRHGTEYG